MRQAVDTTGSVHRLALAVLLVLGACASDDGDDTASTGANGGTVAATQPEAEPADTEPAATEPSATEPGPTEPPATELPSTEPPATEVPPTAPGLADRACPDGAPPQTRCHTLEVPADWSDPDAGEVVLLPIAVLPAQGAVTRPDPVVIPSGGPGSPGAEKFGEANGPLNQARDIVLYDQRGTGGAVPSLECPEMDEVFVANLQRVDSFEAELQPMLDAAEACRTRLEGMGVDLDDYDSVQNALDLDAIREALGYDEWNILGISYGGRLALTAMRSTPDGVRSVILDSVSDVVAGGDAAQIASGERAFAILAAECAADPACAETYGDVNELIESVRQRYNADSIVVDVDLDDGSGAQTFAVNGDDVMAALFNALYTTSLIPLLPSLLAGLDAGETGIVAQLIHQGVAQGTESADGMQMSFDCADNAGLDQAADAAARDDPGRLPLIAVGPLCSEWPVEPTAPDYNEPVESDIPALVLAGLYDPVTPSDRTEAVAARLPNATYALFVDAGHGATGGECANQLELAFLDDPEAPVDLSCVDDVQRVAFL